MTKFLFVILALTQLGCKDALQNGDGVKIIRADTTSIETIIQQVRHQTLSYLDTIIGKDSKRVVRFHSKLDSLTYQTLQNWIFHHESKIHVSDKEVLNLLDKPHVDGLLLSKYDTTLLTNATNTDKITQIYFDGFTVSSDTTKIATVIGVYFGDESERITGWKEFLVFSKQGNSYTISKKGIVTEY